MDIIIAAPASCKVRAVIRFLHAEGQSVGEIHRRLRRVYCDNVVSEMLNKLQRMIQNRRRGLLTKCVITCTTKSCPSLRLAQML
jgi:hypothetical protein